MIYIKEWFFNKIQNEHRNLHLIYDGVQIERETEKAYLVCVRYVTADGEHESCKNEAGLCYNF